MPEVQHTAGRWEADYEGDDQWAINADVRHIQTGGGWKHIAVLKANKEGSAAVSVEEAEANAKLIVRAVNSHAKLVALLTAAKVYVALGMANSTKSTAAARGTAAKDLRDIEAALAEARGESDAR
jgi:hypothetical protein